MLAGMSSKMYSEWIAYEQFTGPIGPKYMLETQRVIIDLLRANNYITGGQYKKNPAPQPVKAFPSEVDYMKPESQLDDDEMDREDAMDAMDTLTGKEG